MIKMMRVRDVKMPNRAHEFDAGIDFFVPMDFPGARLKHGQSVLIPSGVKVEVPRGWCMVMTNKSGVASKNRLDTLACVIDHGYTGEVHINLVNNGIQDVVIEPGMKIVQGILYQCGLHMPVEVESILEDSERGAKGFGSTDNQ